MEAIAFIAVAVAFVLAVFSSARWALGELDCAAANSSVPVQFTISDVLCLFVYAQAAFGSCRWSGGPSRFNSELNLTAAVGFIALALVIWYFGVAVLSRARIRNSWHRVFVLILGIPLNLLGSTALPIIPLVVLGNAREGNRVLLWSLVLIPVIFCLLTAIRLIVRRIVARAKAGTA